jgi:hypothetical protein
VTKPADWAPKTEAEIIRDRAIRSGLTKNREEDFAFLIAARHAGAFGGPSLRKFGTPLTAEERKALGLTGRAVCTREFVDILSEAGLKDPEHAAHALMSTANSALVAERDLAKLATFGPEMKALFRASQMAAGPCPRAAQLDGKIFEPGEADIPPFADCTHPDQCACMYQARLVLD